MDMRRTHTLVNDAQDDLEVWVEPWADLYVVRRGSKVAFSFAAEGKSDLLESKIAVGKMTFWFSGPDAPEVEIDGTEAEPMDQYEWKSRNREARP